MTCSFNSEANYCLQEIKRIEDELKTEPVTPDQRSKLFQQLDAVSSSLSTMEAQAAQVNRFALSFLAEIRSQTIELYGKIDDFSIKYEVQEIKKEADVLKSLIDKRDFVAIARIANQLKDHIIILFRCYSPCLADRQVIILAKLMAENGFAILEGKPILDLDLDSWIFLEAQQVAEEIAELLGSNSKAEARAYFRRLSELQKRLVLSYFAPGFLHDIEASAEDNQFFFG